jgi:hypothetical protein
MNSIKQILNNSQFFSFLDTIKNIINDPKYSKEQSQELIEEN